MTREQEVDSDRIFPRLKKAPLVVEERSIDVVQEPLDSLGSLGSLKETYRVFLDNIAHRLKHGSVRRN